MTTPSPTPRQPLARHCLCSVCCAITAALFSCSDTVDDYFPLTATERLQTTIARVQQTLRSAEYGWELEYYPGSELKYGGIVYTVKFDSLTATVGCSLIADSTETTFYRMTNDNGPVLTFDTYNSLLHYFSTPSSAEYEGKGGEFEFVVDSIADDLITLYGKKTRNTMYLRRLTATPDEYATRTIANFDRMPTHFEGTADGAGTASITADCDLATKSIFFHLGTDTVTVPFTFNDRGIRLYRPVSFKGQRIQSFDFDPDSLTLTATAPGVSTPGSASVSGGSPSGTLVLQGQPFPDDFMYFARYEGDYRLLYKGGNVDVTLKPNRLEGTYLMKGLSPSYDLTLRYDAATGNLTLGSQVVGEADGHTYYWVAYDYNAGSLSLLDEAQFTITWNKNRFYPVFNIAATNPHVLNCTGGLLIYVYTDSGGTLRAAVADDEAFMTNGSAIFEELKSLNRKTRL